MAGAKKETNHKLFRLDSVKLMRAQEALQASTETETVERSLDLIIAEDVHNRLTVKANSGSSSAA